MEHDGIATEEETDEDVIDEYVSAFNENEFEEETEDENKEKEDAEM